MIYEIRTYQIAPGSLGEVEKRFGDAYQYRKKYSELTAFLHTEVERILHALPESSGVIVYQHRSQRERWDSVFDKLRLQLGYATFAAAVFEPNVALVMVARTVEATRRLSAAAKVYAAKHDSVGYRELDLRNERALSSFSANRQREPGICECGCGGPTKSRFMPGHDTILRAWVLRVERRVIRLDEIPHDGIRAAVARVLSEKR